MRKLVHNTMVLIGFFLITNTTFGAEPVPFDQAAFDEATAAKKTVLVGFHADWCSTCVKQEKSIHTLLKEKDYEDIVVFVANYDKSDALKKKMGVSKQSTLVLFNGEREVSRQMGLTSVESIRKFLRGAI